MPGRGCVDQMFTLQQIVEKCLHANVKLYCAFVDLEKAYDTVNRDKLWSVLSEYGVSGSLVNAIKAMYDESKACVRVNGGTSGYFKIGQGVRQGCVMSPWLFNVFMDKCIRSACQDINGMSIGNTNVQILMYADDAVLVAESMNDLQQMLSKFADTCENMDLKVNARKTKVVVFNKQGENENCQLMLGNEEIEQVNEFVYLGRMFTNDGKMDMEIERRVNAGRKVIGSMWAVNQSEQLSMEAKKAVYNSVVVPTVLYGSETWVCQNKHVSKINAVGMRYLRSACGKTRRDKMKNEWIRNECGIKATLNDVYERSTLRWFGHVERMSNKRLTKRVYEGKVDGKLGKGRPKKRWLDGVNGIIKNREIRSMKNKRACQKQLMNLMEAKEVCKNRSEWRKIVKGSVR